MNFKGKTMEKALWVIAIIFAAFIATGCGTDTKTETQYVPVASPVEPAQPIEVQPTEPDNAIPSSGVGSISGLLDCSGGTITTKYSFGDVDGSDNAFAIQYSRNGQTQDISSPATSHNGSRVEISDIFYAGANPDDNAAIWIVRINYQLPDETYTLKTVSLSQPSCQNDGNLTTAETIVRYY